MQILHPENLGEVIHFDIPLGPPVKFCCRIVVLVARDVSCSPRNGTGNDHRSECAKQSEVRIRRFHWLGVEGFVESREAVATDFDPARSNACPGAEMVHDENDSKESRELAAAGALIVRVSRDKVQTHDGASVSVDNGEGRCPELVFEGPVADCASRASSERCKDSRLKIRWKR